MGNGGSSPLLAIIPLFFLKNAFFHHFSTYNIYMNIFSQKNMMVLTITCLLVASSSCSFVPGKSSALELIPGWPQETVEIHLPAYPVETHPPLAGWKLAYLQGGQQKTEILPASTASVHLSLDKNQPTAVLFYPLTQLQGQPARFFRPAGCIYPYKRDASWLEGFTAEILFQLAKSMSPEELATSPLSRFNWPRLTQQAEKLAQKAVDKGTAFSPWFLQAELLKDAILQGTAANRSIRQHSASRIPLGDIAMGEQPTDQRDSPHVTQKRIYYRYIPLGFIPTEETPVEPESTEHTSEVDPFQLTVPLQGDYRIHSENAFLMGDKIFTLFTRKKQKPALVTTGIERYTEGQ